VAYTVLRKERASKAGDVWHCWSVFMIIMPLCISMDALMFRISPNYAIHHACNEHLALHIQMTIDIRFSKCMHVRRCISRIAHAQYMTSCVDARWSDRPCAQTDGKAIGFSWHACSLDEGLASVSNGGVLGAAESDFSGARLLQHLLVPAILSYLLVEAYRQLGRVVRETGLAIVCAEPLSRALTRHGSANRLQTIG
jgi:hypothetical protein